MWNKTQVAIFRQDYYTKVLGLKEAYRFAGVNGAPDTIALQVSKDTFIEMAPPVAGQLAGLRISALILTMRPLASLSFGAQVQLWTTQRLEVTTARTYPLSPIQTASESRSMNYLRTRSCERPWMPGSSESTQPEVRTHFNFASIGCA